VGWSSEALRLMDLCIVAGIIAWLASTVPPRRSAVKLWIALVLAYFYFAATSEWSHCQTDTWMLVPSIAAFMIHKWRFLNETRHSSPSAPFRRGDDIQVGSLVGSAFAEGICWGIAFTIKPFVACPALACWIVTTIAARK